MSSNGSNAAANDLEGALLGGRYRVRGLLGQGGMGTVYAAVQEDLGRRVALKVIREEDGLDDEDIRRLRQEALAAARLGHPNIVQVTDFQTPPGEPAFLVMEQLDGISLDALLRREGRIAVPRAAAIATQILAALGAAHAANIIHRDIKPANVFLLRIEAAEDLVKVLDFGIAKVYDEGRGPLTATGAVVGTPSYMSPEQALGLSIDGRTDLYAVGATLFQMLTGSRLFRAASTRELLIKVTREPPPRLLSLVPELDPRLASVVERALSKDPDDRPTTASEMIALLGPFTARGASPAVVGSRSSSGSGSAPHATIDATASTIGAGTLVAAGAVTPAATRSMTTAMPPMSPRALPVARTPPAPPQPVMPTPPMGARPMPRPSSAPAIVGVVCALVVFLATATWFVIRLLAKITAQTGVPGISLPASVEHQAAAPPATTWEPEGLPLLASLVGDATEDVVGPIHPGDSVAQLHETVIAVFDGATRAIAWMTPPLTGEKAGWGFAPYALANRRVVTVTEGRTIHLYDGATGHEVKTATASSKVTSLCTPRGSLSEVFVDEAPIAEPPRGEVVDVNTGALRRAPTAPIGCTDRPDWATPFHIAPSATAAKVQVKPEGIYELEAEGIAVSIDGPPKGDLVLNGRDLVTRKTLWSQPFAFPVIGGQEILEIAGGRVYVQHVAANQTAVVDALDARSGRILWTATPPPPSGPFATADAARAIRFGASRAYVVRSTQLDVVDLATGRFLGTMPAR